jgi:HSP20 family protein
MPVIDMYQTDDDVVVKATLPGIKASDVQISVTGDMLTLKGELKEKEEVKEKAYHIREHRYGSLRADLQPADRRSRRQGQGRVRGRHPDHHPAQG